MNPNWIAAQISTRVSFRAAHNETGGRSRTSEASTLSRTPSDRYTGIAQGSTAVFIAAEVLSTGLAVLGYVG